MSLNVTITEDRYLTLRQFGCALSWGILVILTFVACRTTSPEAAGRSEPGEQVFDLKHASAERCIDFLRQLGLEQVSAVSEANAVLVAGPPEQLRRAALVVDLIDAKEGFVIENLGPVSMARKLPSNSQIASALGDIRIRTFADPPEKGEHARGIIDIQGSVVLAILPASHRERLLELLARATSEALPVRPELAAGEHREPRLAENARDVRADAEPAQLKAKMLTQDAVSPKAPIVIVPGDEYVQRETGTQAPSLARPEPSISNHKALPPDSRSQENDNAASLQPIDDGSVGVPKTLRVALKPAKDTSEIVATASSGSVKFQNGEDILDIALPETMTLIQLLDLAGEYLGLNYVYDPAAVGSQSVTLKLHGRLQGEMRVKELYSILETVLKFKGLAMTRREDGLVTIVPVAQALDADPELVDVKTRTVQVGDMVVTRVFELQHVDVASVTNLLQNMKLGVAVTSSEGTQLLFVTCYAHRMSRIEQMVDMLDRPGRARECRFRRLQYTAARALVDKIRTLGQELRGIPVAAVSAAGKSSPAEGKGSGGPRAAGPVAGQSVYLDTDERTNRLLMIGYEEQLGLLEGLIDALDVAQEDLRTLKVYDVRHMKAQEALQKLQELAVLDQPAASTAGPRRGTSGTSSSARAGKTQDGVLAEEPIVVVLEATNQLLVNTTQEQHAQIRESLGYIDVSPEDLRILRVYDIEHVGAYELNRKLQEAEITGGAVRSAGPARTATQSESQPATKAAGPGPTGQALVTEPQVIVREATNSLLVNATEEQHARIAAMVRYLDVATRQQAIPCEIYFLENQDPEHLAQVLEKIIRETITDKEGKVEKVIARMDEQIVIVPDANTFSLIVYANKKNQEWVNKLIKALDRRRPQVLIDATLVEIRKTDEFNYDLNLIQSFPDLTATSGLTETIVPGESPITSSDIIGKLASSGRDRFIDYQSRSGALRGFYGDKHINVLLDAMQSKNYGRVLAKPKVLVNDNETGTIKTTDSTYVEKKTSIPVVTGAAGQQSTLIETAIDFQKYEAGIKLEITPHISEGDLLRLEITLSRSDFGTVTGKKPPDQTTSDIKTVVTIPDGSTIILGGMLKLNQSKGGTKVPILGDLPLVGILFRSVARSDIQSKLYVFVRAEVIRPAEALAGVQKDLERISERSRAAFEKHEEEFQNYQDWPGIKPEPVEPEKVLEAH